MKMPEMPVMLEMPMMLEMLKMMKLLEFLERSLELNNQLRFVQCPAKELEL